MHLQLGSGILLTSQQPSAGHCSLHIQHSFVPDHAGTNVPAAL